MAQTRSKTKSVLVPALGAWDDSDSDLTDLSSEDEQDELEPTPPPPPKTQRQPLNSNVHTKGKGGSAAKGGGTAGAVAGPSSRPVPTTTRQVRATTQKMTERSKQQKSSMKLETPVTCNQSLSTLYDLMCAGRIELDPPYQRDVVWNDQKQTKLIDSFFNNFPIPPIIFSLSQDEYGRDVRTCIDGKQRLTSIYRFMSGEIPWKPDVPDEGKKTSKKQWFTTPKDKKEKRPKILSLGDQCDFKMKSLCMLDYKNLTEAQEREIFQRVQLGVSLTPVERLQAQKGEYAKLVTDQRDRLRRTTVFRNFSEWGGNKGRDFFTVAQIAYLLQSHLSKSPIQEPTLLRVGNWLGQEQKSTFELNQLEQTVQHAFNIFCRIACHPVYSRPLVASGLTPNEIILSVYLIHVSKKRMTDCQTSDAIGRLRAAITLPKRIGARNKDSITKDVYNRGIDFIQSIGQRGSADSFIADNDKRLSADVPPLGDDELFGEDDADDTDARERVKTVEQGAKKRKRTRPEDEHDMAVDSTFDKHAAAKRRRSDLDPSHPTKTTHHAAPKKTAAPMVVDSDDEDVPLRAKPAKAKPRTSTSKPTTAPSQERSKPATTSKPRLSVSTNVGIHKPVGGSGGSRPVSPTDTFGISGMPTAKSQSHPSRKRSLPQQGQNVGRRLSANAEMGSVPGTPVVPSATPSSMGMFTYPAAVIAGKVAPSSQPAAAPLSQGSFSAASGDSGRLTNLRNAARKAGTPTAQTQTQQQMQVPSYEPSSQKYPTPPAQTKYPTPPAQEDASFMNAAYGIQGQGQGGVMHALGLGGPSLTGLNFKKTVPATAPPGPASQPPHTQASHPIQHRQQGPAPAHRLPSNASSFELRTPAAFPSSNPLTPNPTAPAVATTLQPPPSSAPASTTVRGVQEQHLPPSVQRKSLSNGGQGFPAAMGDSSGRGSS